MTLILELWFLVGFLPVTICLFVNETAAMPAVSLFPSSARSKFENLILFLMAWTLWPIYTGFTIEWFWFGGKQRFDDKLREYMAAKRRNN